MQRHLAHRLLVAAAAAPGCTSQASSLAGGRVSGAVSTLPNSSPLQSASSARLGNNALADVHTEAPLHGDARSLPAGTATPSNSISCATSLPVSHQLQSRTCLKPQVLGRRLYSKSTMGEAAADEGWASACMSAAAAALAAAAVAGSAALGSSSPAIVPGSYGGGARGGGAEEAYGAGWQHMTWSQCLALQNERPASPSSSGGRSDSSSSGSGSSTDTQARAPAGGKGSGSGPAYSEGSAYAVYDARGEPSSWEVSN